MNCGGKASRNKPPPIPFVRDISAPRRPRGFRQSLQLAKTSVRLIYVGLTSVKVHELSVFSFCTVNGAFPEDTPRANYFFKECFH